MAHKTRWHTKQLKTLQNWKNCETCALYISFLPNNPEFDKPLYSSTYVRQKIGGRTKIFFNWNINVRIRLKCNILHAFHLVFGIYCFVKLDKIRVNN